MANNSWNIVIICIMTSNDNNGRVLSGFWLNGAQKVLLHFYIALPLASQLKKFVNWPIKGFLFKMWPSWGTLFCQLFFISLSRVDLPRAFGRFLSFFLSFQPILTIFFVCSVLLWSQFTSNALKMKKKKNWDWKNLTLPALQFYTLLLYSFICEQEMERGTERERERVIRSSPLLTNRGLLQTTNVDCIWVQAKRNVAEQHSKQRDTHSGSLTHTNKPARTHARRHTHTHK